MAEELKLAIRVTFNNDGLRTRSPGVRLAGRLRPARAPRHVRGERLGSSLVGNSWAPRTDSATPGGGVAGRCPFA
jgi:hypothetical protein